MAGRGRLVYGFRLYGQVTPGMAGHLVIVLLNTPLENAAAPLAQAAVAAAMGTRTDVVFTGASGAIAVEGAAASQPAEDGSGRSLHALIADAAEAGVTFRICSPAVARFGDALIPEIREVVGAAWLAGRVMDPDTVTLTY
ncbi:Predicted peroxiredoxin [Aquisalimonas asiatica]|uniref:Predicted peroxiredoxin n=2 Tax=Aquisalimonas asiatica TaxID=406100 RepID=A0A1H8Q6N0_9GAMM|nr:Predicted peroxiredoxin [Aquisalimonas asiatica]